MRDFFIHNALYWLKEYRFDGLRLDAVHAIHDDSVYCDELAATVRGRRGAERHVHLVLENEHNEACRLERAGRSGFDAQWNDDFHHAAHVLLTGETEGYYADYADAPAARLARCWRRASPTRAKPSRCIRDRRAARRAAAPTCRSPPSWPSCRTTTRSATARSASG